MIDLDPQGNASTGFAIQSNKRQPGAYEVLTEDEHDAIKPAEVNGLGVVPSSVSLAKAEYEVNNGDGNEFILKQAIEKLPVDFSAIIIDCPPGLGFLTTNALTASNKVLFPQYEFYALRDLAKFSE